MDKTFNNLDDLFDDFKKHPEDIFDVGDKVDIKCPYCNKDIEAVYLGNSEFKCPSCNKIIEANFEVD